MRMIGRIVVLLFCCSMVGCADSGDPAPQAGGGSAPVGASGGDGGGSNDGGAPMVGGGGASVEGGAGGSGERECPVFEGLTMTIGKHGYLTPEIGGADQVWIEAPIGATGSYALTLPAFVSDCSNGGVCVYVTMGSASLATLSGTIDIEESSEYYVTATMRNLELIQIESEESGAIHSVPGGVCASISSLSFHSEPPVPGWSCYPDSYDQKAITNAQYSFCDCACGAADPDCENPTLMVASGDEICPDGSVCSATFDGCVPP